MVTPNELDSLKMQYKVSGIIELEVMSLDEGVVDFEGFTSKVAIYPGCSLVASSCLVTF